LEANEYSSAIDKAFSSGNQTLGLSLLRKQNMGATATAASWHRQAVVEEQIGDWNAAGEAHYYCYQSAPQMSSAYLYAAYWLEKSAKFDAAAAAYSLAQEANPNIFHTNDSSKQNQMRAKCGKQLLTSWLSSQHRELLDVYASTPRIKNSIWMQTHDKKIDFNQEGYAPNLFYIPNLECKPVYSDQQFKWAKKIKSATSIIKNELTYALQKKSAFNSVRPYLPKEFSTHTEMQALAGSKDWSALDLFRDGKENTELSALFPETLKLISSLPTYALESHPFEVFFSLLKPKQEIPPHFGESNHSLTVHLGIEVPDIGYLTVDQQPHNWVEGELIIFDDSYLHSAHNLSDKLRIVLIFSIWHPSLSLAEQETIKACFQKRREWMKSRVSKLEQLLPSAEN